MKAQPDSHGRDSVYHGDRDQMETSPRTSTRDLLLKENETKHTETTLY